MPEKSWPANQSNNPLDGEMTKFTKTPTHPFYNNKFKTQKDSGGQTAESDLTQAENPTHSLPQAESISTSPAYSQGRRRKAAVALTMIWGGTITLHFVSWGSWFILGLTGLLSIHALRICCTRPRSRLNGSLTADQTDWPFVSLLVSAKNEEAVITNLVQNLCNLDYPSDCYELWVIDDNSTDGTPQLLDQLAQKYQQLRVLHRRTVGGGKSGALNQVLPLTQGEILAVFDADAEVTPDLLRQVVPVFEAEQVGAVQVRKAISNEDFNFWARSQVSEMALDAFFQQQRITVGGIGELRGNGQFVRRTALEACGGWNEETITDDLDLTIRLHLNRWDIEFLAFPAVLEEGVTQATSLWHQRNRWAEGGYQRYLDYWKFILSNRMGTRKTFDLFGFLIIQYLLPTAAIPDCLMAVALRRLPVTSPLTLLALSLSFFGMFVGIRRTRKQQPITSSPMEVPPLHGGTITPRLGRKRINPLQSGLELLHNLFQTWRGTLYMFHWFFVVGSATVRMSVRPKRLKWVKTVHQGTVTHQH